MVRFISLFLILLVVSGFSPDQRTISMISPEKTRSVIDKMTAKFGTEHKARIENGAVRVGELWRKEDGSEKDYEDFCLTEFIADPAGLDKTFSRLEKNFEVLQGHLHQISRALREPLDLDIGPPLPIDHMFAKYSPFAHLEEDFFGNKIAFVMILNFPYFTLDQKLSLGENWDRKQWAYAKLGDMFTSRVPADVRQKRSAISVEADNYVSEYNVYMGNLLTADQKTLFPPDLKLISHWGIRDELKAQYAKPDGLERQRIIYRVMQRIIDQSIPKIVVNNDKYRWAPEPNLVYEKRNAGLEKVTSEPEKQVRYEQLLNKFKAEQMLDPYVPKAPTLIERRFNEDRQIPEKEVEKLLLAVVSSPLRQKVAQLIEKRLGRKLEPFDIWYDGFKARGAQAPEELDRIVRQKYPEVTAFQADLPKILQKLGFAGETAEFLSRHIVVDPARGSGHATGAEMRDDKAHLRTRATGGLNYKGYNIALHEMGHTVEQVFSLNRIDYYFLRGVPNTAFTEAFAFVFQDRDLDVLGIPSPGREERDALKALDTFWATYEIGGVALVDMKVWRWMYENPKTDPQQLRDAVMRIAREVWNEHYAPVFGVRDVPILAIYSHLIDGAMYLPDYPIGHIISFQIESYLKGKNLGVEMERMCRLGCLTPSLWMEQAVGTPLSTQPLLQAAEQAVGRVK
ncbi:MAG: hypothetical protein EHM61_15935 [Acidobacteria bacterium]|nr:MAG: hypothetical protein EHM61_15935 [Acidobacteriota bacterium]